jgi:hypothetical protein
MARFFVAVMATVAVLACSPGSSENDKCGGTPDCQAQLTCIFTPGVCKRTCVSDTECDAFSKGETCQCTGSLQHCDKAPPDGGHADAGCGG